MSITKIITKTLTVSHFDVNIGGPKGNRYAQFILRFIDSDGNQEATSVMLTGEEYDTFHSNWTEDKQVYQLFKDKGLIPEDAVLPEGDLLNG